MNEKTVQIKCPKCGSSEIIPIPETGKLKCNYCNTEFVGEKIEEETSVDELKGTIIEDGAKNIKKDVLTLITLKCDSCGAEIIVNSDTTSTITCHWCHSMLSPSSKGENAAAPDAILPFKLTKEEAKKKIKKFVNSRRLFAKSDFKKNLNLDNVMGVYFPYYIVDAKAHPKYSGLGEHQTKKWDEGTENHSEWHYNADLYQVERTFDMTIDEFTIEANSNQINKYDSVKTNNIINSIMPFDTENKVEYASNYLIGFHSEKRDMNINEIQSKAYEQIRDIAKIGIRKDISFYNRGVQWTQEDLNLEGIKWTSIYLPVWLYSHLEKTEDKEILHYIAVNGRTGETMGSIPLKSKSLNRINTVIGIFVLLSILIILGGWLVGMMSFGKVSDDPSNVFLIMNLPMIGVGLLLLSVVALFVFLSIEDRYRNKEARHEYEKETKHKISNVKENDSFIEHREDIRNHYIEGRNDNTVEGKHVG